MGCYNCGGNSHIAKECDQPQNVTRCPTCNCAFKHKDWCTNQSFRSTLVKQPIIPGIVTKFFFTNVKYIKVCDVDIERNITTLPLFIPSQKIVVQKENSHLKCLTFNEATAFIDLIHDNGKVQLNIEKKMIIVNDRYKLLEDGTIQQWQAGPTRRLQPTEIKLTLRANEFMFRIEQFQFIVGDNGLILNDVLTSGDAVDNGPSILNVVSTPGEAAIDNGPSILDVVSTSGDGAVDTNDQQNVSVIDAIIESILNAVFEASVVHPDEDDSDISVYIYHFDTSSSGCDADLDE